MGALKLLAGVSAACLLASACASTEDVRAMRRQPLPPRYVALAETNSPLHENVALYEIVGAPEFRLFDGDAIITTRPTREDVAHMMRGWLASADMLAPNLRNADYLLTVEFEYLRGPDVIPFSDKNARASVRYTLRERRTGQPVFAETYQAQLQARMPGVTEEMVRAAIVSGLIGVAAGPEIAAASDPTAAAASVGALLGGHSAAFAAAHDTLLWDWPQAAMNIAPRTAQGLGIGAVVGGFVGEGGPGNDPTARWRGGAGGALTGMTSAAPSGRPAEHWDDASVPGAFNGTHRRAQAVHGMMLQNFNRFIFGLEAERMIAIREAVSCDELNPLGYGPGIVTANATQVGYDCPIGDTRPVRRF